MDSGKHASYKGLPNNVKTECSSWRQEVLGDGVLACQKDLNSPWLVSFDPNSYQKTHPGSCTEYIESHQLHNRDRRRIFILLARYAKSKQPGICTIFSYGKNENVDFEQFVTLLANQLGCVAYFGKHRRSTVKALAGVLVFNCEKQGGIKKPLKSAPPAPFEFECLTGPGGTLYWDPANGPQRKSNPRCSCLGKSDDQKST